MADYTHVAKIITYVEISAESDTEADEVAGAVEERIIDLIEVPELVGVHSISPQIHDVTREEDDDEDDGDDTPASPLAPSPSGAMLAEGGAR